MTNLEHSLKAAAEPWLADGGLSDERSAALMALVRRRHRSRMLRRWVGVAAATSVLILGTVSAPLVIAVASGAPIVGPYIARMAMYDAGAHWADQKGFVVPVGKSVTDQGYTFRVESVMADSARTMVYFVLEGAGLEKLSPFPRPHLRFNLKHSGGGSSGRGELVDGRLVGSLEFPPLPTPTSLVSLDLTEIGKMKGDWSLSFMASRLELDRLARVIDLDRRLTGPGYDLVVRRALLAPTQTIIEVEGRVDAGVELRPLATLAAGGAPVKQHNTQYTRGGTVISHRFAFDRVDPDAAGEAVLNLTGLVRWQAGGPSLELKPGSRTEHGEFWLEFVRTERSQGSTAVTVRIPWSKANFLKLQDYEEWSVLDADGTAHPVNPAVTAQGDGTGLMTVHVRGLVSDPVRLQSGRYAEPVPGDFSVKVPLK